FESGPPCPRDSAKCHTASIQQNTRCATESTGPCRRHFVPTGSQSWTLPETPASPPSTHPPSRPPSAMKAPVAVALATRLILHPNTEKPLFHTRPPARQLEPTRPPPVQSHAADGASHDESPTGRRGRSSSAQDCEMAFADACSSLALVRE